MNLGIRKEEAIYIKDIIYKDIMDYGVKELKQLYGNIDLEGILRQLEVIIQIGESVEEEIKL